MNRIFACAFPGIGALGVFFYFWAANVTEFTTTSILVSTAVVVFIGLFLFCLNYFLTWKFVHEVINESHQELLYYIILSLTFSFFVFYCINCHVPFQIGVVGPLACFSLLILCLLERQKLVMIFLCAFLGLQVAQFGFNSWFLRHEQNEIMAAAGFPADIPKLVHKPNIYVCWLGAHQDFAMLAGVYGMDISPFRDFLLKNKFHIADNIYSSAAYVPGSMAQFYSARFIRDTAQYPTKPAQFWLNRDILGGGEYNYVYKVLKNNGYRTVFISPPNQWDFMGEKGAFLDETAYDQPFYDKYLSPITTFLYPSVQSLFYIDPNAIQKNYRPANGYGGSLVNQLANAMEKAKKSGVPSIISIMGGPPPTPNEYDWQKRKEWIDSGQYREQVTQSDRETEEVINYIIKNDNNSIILLMGGEGPCSYRHIAAGAASAEELVDDVFRVFFAWRMPEGMDYDLSHGMYMNNVNVFTHILAWMADDPKLLATRATSMAYWWMGIKMIENEIVSEDYIP